MLADPGPDVRILASDLRVPRPELLPASAARSDASVSGSTPAVSGSWRPVCAKYVPKFLRLRRQDTRRDEP